jgi:hypothetical protein
VLIIASALTLTLSQREREILTLSLWASLSLWERVGARVSLSLWASLSLWERVGVRVRERACHFLPNPADHRLSLLKNLAISEPQRPYAS